MATCGSADLTVTVQFGGDKEQRMVNLCDVCCMRGHVSNYIPLNNERSLTVGCNPNGSKSHAIYYNRDPDDQCLSNAKQVGRSEVNSSKVITCLNLKP